MSTNLIRGPKAPIVQSQDTNLGNLAGASDEVYDQLFFPPAAAQMLSGASLADDASTLWPVASLPASAFTRVVWTSRSRARWNHHQAAVRLLYSCDTAGTSAFTVACVLRGLRAGGALGSPILIGNSGVAIPGPATASTLLTAAFTLNSAPLTLDMEALTLTVNRTAPDANANALLVLGVLLRIYSL